MGSFTEFLATLEKTDFLDRESVKDLVEECDNGIMGADIWTNTAISYFNTRIFEESKDYLKTNKNNYINNEYINLLKSFRKKIDDYSQKDKVNEEFIKLLIEILEKSIEKIEDKNGILKKRIEEEKSEKEKLQAEAIKRREEKEKEEKRIINVYIRELNKLNSLNLGKLLKISESDEFKNDDDTDVQKIIENFNDCILVKFNNFENYKKIKGYILANKKTFNSWCMCMTKKINEINKGIKKFEEFINKNKPDSKILEILKKVTDNWSINFKNISEEIIEFEKKYDNIISGMNYQKLKYEYDKPFQDIRHSEKLNPNVLRYSSKIREFTDHVYRLSDLLSNIMKD